MIFCFVESLCASSERLQLKRITIPSQMQLEHEKTVFYQRQIKRYLVRVGTTASILAVMYITYKATEYFKEIDKRVEKVNRRVAAIETITDVESKKNDQRDLVSHKAVDQASAKIEPVTLFGPIKLVGNGIKHGAVSAKNFMVDLGKCVIESCPNFITGMMLSTLWQQAYSRIVEASKLETLSWYIDEYTQTWLLFHDISLACVPYDLHSELLSLQQIDHKAGVSVRSYVDELAELVANHKENCTNDGYFEYASNNIKKGYGQKSFELTELQNYAAPNIAKRKRATQEGLQAGFLFQTDQVARQNLADLTNLLADQMQKIINFAVMHIDKNRSKLSQEIIDRGQKRVAQIIDSMNRYLDQMESLLSMSDQELEGMSIAHKGMFTCTYEYERLFREQVNILHRYCSFIS